MTAKARPGGDPLQVVSALIMGDGRLWELAGGDVRFGGLYDLLGLARDYDSEQVVTRFAVVRRERMVAW